MRSLEVLITSKSYVTARDRRQLGMANTNK